MANSVRWHIPVAVRNGRTKYYGFYTSADYTGHVAALGLKGALSATEDSTTIGTYANYPIVKIRLKTVLGSYTRLCAAGRASFVLENPGTLMVLGNQVLEAKIVRKRVRL